MSFLKPDVATPTPSATAPSTASFASRGTQASRGGFSSGRLPPVTNPIIGRSSSTTRPSLLGG